MPLRISMKDGEEIIINGALIRATGRISLEIKNAATVLRGKELMRVEEATTPARRLYLACMMAYVDGEGRPAHQDSLVELIRDLLDALQSQAARNCLIIIAQKVACGEFYKALSDCRWLISYEAKAMARDLPEAV